MRLSNLIWIFGVLVVYGFGVHTGFDISEKQRPPAAPVFASCGPSHVMAIGDGVLRVVTDVDTKERF